uniref:LRAT domain-containing protein n=1 Tax=Fundulus heteroclitus TaxID=8078 RepID=A0A3Q2U1T8_FUNHE
FRTTHLMSLNELLLCYKPVTSNTKSVFVHFLQAYKFGDIIAFPRDLSSHGGLSLYKHYAIYVGSKKFVQQTPEEDIFHMTGSVSQSPDLSGNCQYSNCVFGKLSKHRKHELDNYLDEIWQAEGLKINPYDIMRRIKETYRNCGRWNAITNNCEHIATCIRYGLKISWQVCGGA